MDGGMLEPVGGGKAALAPEPAGLEEFEELEPPQKNSADRPSGTGNANAGLNIENGIKRQIKR